MGFSTVISIHAVARRASALATLLVIAASLVGCDESKPPTAEPASLAPIFGSTKGGDDIAIVGKGFTEGSVVLFDGIPAKDVQVTAGVVIAKTPPHAVGEVVVTVYDSLGRAVDVPSTYEYVEPIGVEGKPRLVGAISLNNTTVRVTYSEPVAVGAEKPENYSIVQANVNPESGALRVISAAIADDELSVILTTGSQSEVTYDLGASNIRDLEGNLLAPPELLVNPSVVEFAGTPPSADGTLVDTDGDGLPDHVEQSGWTVTVMLINGDIVQSTTTSDPTLVDTDGDGLNDAGELLAGSNPRLPDTDGDTIIDPVELDAWHSDPTDQDSDNDQLDDSTDLFFDTSPILADTDGDGMDDRDELFLFNRNPLLANLPKPQIVVGDYSLRVDITSSFTDETGAIQSVQSSIASAVSQAQSRALNRSDTRSTESANSSSQEFGGEVSYGTTDGFAATASFNAGFEQASARGYSSTVDTQTAVESQQAFEQSQTDALEVSELRSVSRSIDGASVQATINVANQGEVPFTITNLEISLQRQDRGVGGAFRPVATLRPSGGQELALNMGPFDSERGPIIFENTDIFPNVVEELIREPSGLVFKVANFDVLDAQGNNFAFSAATVSSRTAGLTIDFGDGRVESYRIATHSAFGADGRPQGISMPRAFELAGLSLQTADTALPDPLPAVLDPAVTNSVGTLDDDTGVERLVRIRGIQNDLRGLAVPEKRFWTIQSNNPSIAPDADFSSVQLRAGDEFLLLYTQDIDEDGLHELEENMYGSSDNAVDSDGDGIDDIDEVRAGWTVRVSPGLPRLVFSSPARPDSDLDGLSDLEEREAGTDPNNSDTDGDGLPDSVEVRENIFVRLADGDTDETNNPVVEISPYTDAAIFASVGGTVSLAATGDDEQVIAVNNAASASDIIIAPGPNGRIDTTVGTGIEVFKVPSNIAAGPNGRCDIAATGSDIQVTTVGFVPSPGNVCIRPSAPDFELETVFSIDEDDYVRVGHEGMFSLDPTRADTDFDGVPDGLETRIGINPNSRDAGNVVDSDDDGLRDAEEGNGWKVCLNGSTICEHVTSSNSEPDSDFDGLPDVLEFFLGSHPRKADTDGDGIRDVDEFDSANPVFGGIRYYSDAALAAALLRCDDAGACNIVAPGSITSTHLLYADSDGDTRSDFQEVNVPWNVTGTRINATSTVEVFDYDVSSDPNNANADNDGWNDGEEFTAKTDPGKKNTDGDSRDDDAEPGLGRDPLFAEKLITLDPMELFAVKICDGDGAGEFVNGDITLDHEGALSVLGGFEDCTGKSAGSTCSNPPQHQFLLAAGETFSIFSDTSMYEDDSGTTAEDEFTPFSAPFDFNVSGGSQTLTTKGVDDPNNCELQFKFTISVD